MASRVGKYLLFETLGEGAFGKVKLGVHEETGEQVAVKIMDKRDIRAQEMTMNVRREIAIMKALKHKNIVNLRCVLTSNTKLYIVMDVVTGGELFTKILNEGKLEESIARRYFQQLVDGVEYCHRRGVCHRDLKPENLLIDEKTGELKITDFGLSAMRGANTTEELLHTQCGSPNYCAPEIIARHKEGYNGSKVDAWSCGIILFALLAGYLPFYDENTKVLYRMIQKDDVKFPRRFPADAKDLVLRLLHKDPDKRIALADVKKHPWFVIDYVPDETAALPQSAVSPPVTKRKRRSHSRKPSIDASQMPNVAPPPQTSADSEPPSGTPRQQQPEAASPPGPPLYRPEVVETPQSSQEYMRQSPASVPYASPGTEYGPPIHSHGRPYAPPHASPPQHPRYGPAAGATGHHHPVPYPHDMSRRPGPGGPGGSADVGSTAGMYGRDDKLSLGPGQYAQQPRPPHAMAGAPAGPPGGPVYGSHPSSNPYAPPGPAPPRHMYRPGSGQPPGPVLGPPNGSPGHAQPPPPPYYPPPGVGPPAYQTPHAAHATPAYGHQPSSYMHAQPLQSYQQQRRPQAGSGLPPPPTYQVPLHTSPPSGPMAGAPARPGGMPATGPPTYAAPSPPRTRYSGTSSTDVTPSPSMEMLPSMKTSASSRAGGIDDVPSYASLSAAAGSKPSAKGSEDSAESSSKSFFPPAPPFPAADDGPRPAVSDKGSPPASLGTTTKAETPGKSPRILPDNAWQNGGAGVSDGLRLSAPAASSSGDTRVDTDAGQSGTSQDKGEGKSDRTFSQVSVSSDTSDGPVSMVERRRQMFNQMAEGKPLASAATPVAPSPPVPPVTAVPEPSVGATGTSVEVPSSMPAEEPELNSQIPTTVAGTDEDSKGDAAEEEAPLVSHFADRPETTVQRNFEDSHSSRAPADTLDDDKNNDDDVDNKNDDSLFEGPTLTMEELTAATDYDDRLKAEQVEMPTRKRLTAALARYRRIFQLNHTIGITASPSFGSNRGGPLGEVPRPSDVLSSSNHSGPQAEFFQRAKQVTGAWGVILSQELEDLEDSDEETNVTDTELEAFGKLLDFWDSRRMGGLGAPVLDDEGSMPLTDAEAARIQSLLQKLEPSQVEDDLEEVPDDVVPATSSAGPASDGGVDDAASATANLSQDAHETAADAATKGLLDRDFSDLKIEASQAGSFSTSATPKAGQTGASTGGPPPPPPPPPPFTLNQEGAGHMSGSMGIPPPPPPPPPHLSPKGDATPSGDGPVADSRHGRRGGEIHRPRPPHYPSSNPTTPASTTLTSAAMTSPGDGPISPSGRRRPTVSFDTVDALHSAALSREARSAPDRHTTDIPTSKSVDADLDGIANRRAASSDSQSVGRHSRERPRVSSNASDESGHGSSKAGSTREFDPAVAQRGMFGFGVFSRKSAVSSFDSGLEPLQCQAELGKILTSMGCSVMMKKGEAKIKCEVPTATPHEKMLVSITCVRTTGITTVSFKRGRKDRSHADAATFQEFVEKVSKEFSRQARYGM